MFRTRTKPEPVRLRDLIRGDFSQARRRYQMFKRKCFIFLFLFLPAAVFAILNRAAEEYAKIKALQKKNARQSIARVSH